MAKNNITELTNQQKIAMGKYIEKWKTISRSTNPIDRDKAKSAIKNAYQVSNYKEPEVIFFGSPFAAIKKALEIENCQTYLGQDISHKFSKRVYKHLFHSIQRQLGQSFFYELLNQILYPVISKSFKQG